MRRVTLVRAALTASPPGRRRPPAAPAAAGGPTSALLSIPGAGSTASLYYTDPEYDELADLVGVSRARAGRSTARSRAAHESGPGVTVTWLIHDVEPWRVDRIYLGRRGRAVDLHAGLASGNASHLGEPRAAGTSRRTAHGWPDLLDGLGLGTDASKNTDFDGVAGAPVPGPRHQRRPRPAASPPPAAATEPGWLGRVGWALGGLVGRCPADARVDADGAPSSDEDTGRPRRIDGSVEVLAR